MTSSRRHALLLSVVGLFSAQVSAQIRVVNYNALDSPTDANDSNHISIFGAIATQNVNGIARRPDLVILQEQTNASAQAMCDILNSISGSSNYAVTVPGFQSSFDRQAFVFNTATLTLNNADTVYTAYRPVIRGNFSVVGYQNATLTAYGLHLMASDPVGRAAQALAMRADADSRGSMNAIYAGDYNEQTSDAESYQNATAPGVNQAIDPINQPGWWNSNPAFASIHTQSTRIDSFNGGAGGGVDDRFDIQLVTSPMMDGEGLSYIGPTTTGAPAHSYRAFGNAGTTYNKNINDAANTSQSPTVLDSLYWASDHLPVVADYQLPAKMSVTMNAQPNIVIEGYSGNYQLTISNSAPTTSAYGADELDYSMNVTGATTSTASGSVNATQSTVKNVPWQATALGNRQTSFSVTTSSQEASGSFSSTHNYTVLRHASPSLSQNSSTTNQTIDFGIVSVDAIAQKNFTIFNRAPAGESAGLDVDSATLTGNTTDFSTNLSPLNALAAGQSITRVVSFDANELGPLSATLNIQTSDENLPGATSLASLALSLTGTAAIPGDANLDRQVAFSDLLLVAQNYDANGSFGWTNGDFTGDSAVTFTDLLIVAQNYGRTGIVSFNDDFEMFERDWSYARSLVPEPVCGLISMSVLIVLRRKR